MGKPNDRNYQLRLMFHDTDLKKPEHDEIMIWLDAYLRDPQNTEKLMPKAPVEYGIREYYEIVSVVNKDGTELPPDQNTREYLNDQCRRSLQPRENPRESYRIDPEDAIPKRSHRFKKCRWEAILTDEGVYGRPQRVGFIDMLAMFSLDTLLTRKITKNVKAFEKAHFGYEFEVIDVKETWGWSNEDYYIGFEAKTEIPSIGELLRQMRLYHSTTSASRIAKFYVVAPNSPEAKEILIEQGFHFLEYRPNNDKEPH